MRNWTPSGLLTSLLLSLFISPLLAEECNIPDNVTIFSRYPCEVWQQAQRDWKDSDKMVWFAQVTRGLPYKEQPLVGPLIIVEHYAPFLAYDGKTTISGVFDPRFYVPIVEFCCDHITQRILLHELIHLRYWLQDKDSLDWQHSMHGDELDPFLQAINLWVKTEYPLPTDHSYHPGFAPWKVAPKGWCDVRIN